MDIDDVIISAMEKDPLKIQDAVNDLMVQKAAELVAQRREEMSQSIFGGIPQDDVEQEVDQTEDNPEDVQAYDAEQQEDGNQEDTFSDDDIEEFLDQNLDDLLQDLDNIEAENEEDSQ